MDFLTATQRHTAGILAAVALGKCEVGGVWATMEQRHGKDTYTVITDPARLAEHFR